jgi:peptidoglycan-N-acetylglucosamine deacetylase
MPIFVLVLMLLQQIRFPRINTFTLQWPTMRTYLVKTPRILHALYKSCIWRLPNTKNEVYLTFDDGPHPEATPFVLDQLKKYHAKATFFCIGKNVLAYPEVYQRILEEGHRVGNHTYAHVNGWKTEVQDYIQEIEETDTILNSDLFRPPYGRIKISQIKAIKEKWPQKQIVMWDVLSGDFDKDLNAKDCLRYCTQEAEAGSIIVFHDSEKAFEKLKYALPRLLRFGIRKGWQMKGIG